MNKKLLTFIICLLILLALPLVSLFYSYKGKELRMTALKELAVKSILPESITQQVKSNARYRLFSSNCSDSISIKALIDQFVEEKVEFVFVNDSTFTDMFSLYQMQEWNKKGTITTVQSNDFPIANCAMILANDKNEVLNSYSLADNTKMKLVEHLAFMITKK